MPTCCSSALLRLINAHGELWRCSHFWENKNTKYPECRKLNVGVIWADVLESPIYGYSHLPLGNKQTKRSTKRLVLQFFFPQEPIQQGRKFPLLGDQWAFLQKKFNLQQSSCILRHSGTHHTSIVLLAKKPAPHMEVRGEPLDFSRSKCVSLTPSPIVQGKSVFPRGSVATVFNAIRLGNLESYGWIPPPPLLLQKQQQGCIGSSSNSATTLLFSLAAQTLETCFFFLPFEDQRGRQGGRAVQFVLSLWGREQSAKCAFKPWQIQTAGRSVQSLKQGEIK